PRARIRRLLPGSRQRPLAAQSVRRPARAPCVRHHHTRPVQRRAPRVTPAVPEGPPPPARASGRLGHASRARYWYSPIPIRARRAPLSPPRLPPVPRPPPPPPPPP